MTPIIKIILYGLLMFFLAVFVIFPMGLIRVFTGSSHVRVNHVFVHRSRWF